MDPKQCGRERNAQAHSSRLGKHLARSSARELPTARTPFWRLQRGGRVEKSQCGSGGGPGNGPPPQSFSPHRISLFPKPT